MTTPTIFQTRDYVITKRPDALYALIERANGMECEWSGFGSVHEAIDAAAQLEAAADRDAARRATFGARIRALRLGLSLSQAELAARVGVDWRRVSLWERDAALPHPTRRRKLAEALGVTPAELVP
jgi:DNA-binding transcriptional regulator YiaG